MTGNGAEMKHFPELFVIPRPACLASVGPHVERIEPSSRHKTHNSYQRLDWKMCVILVSWHNEMRMKSRKTQCGLSGLSQTSKKWQLQRRKPNKKCSLSLQPSVLLPIVVLILLLAPPPLPISPSLGSQRILCTICILAERIGFFIFSLLNKFCLLPMRRRTANKLTAMVIRYTAKAACCIPAIK